MTVKRLAAPPHLCGPMPRNVDKAHLAERDAWARTQLGLGYSYRDVAAALGISANAVYLAISRATGRKKALPPASDPVPAACDAAGARPKYQVTGVTRRGERIGHVIRAADEDAAAARWLGSYPGGEVATVALIGAEAVE